MDVLDLLAQDNYVPYNKTLAKELGIESAILFGTLCGYQRHYKAQEFYREQANIIEDTCLTEYSVRQATKVLQEKGLIIVTKKGLPAKNYYRINTSKMIEMLSTSCAENDTTGNIEIKSTSDKENTSTNNKINNKINYKYIIDHLNEKTKSNYRSTSAKTQTLIKARVKEGFTEQDFIKVIDNMVIRWTGTEWEQYLTPDTLFGTKFEKYLNTKAVAPKKPTTDARQATSRNYTTTELNSLFTKLE